MSYAYSYTVEYAQYSSNSSAYHPEKWRLFRDEDEAWTFGQKEANRLAAYDNPIRRVYVERFCVECDGRGTQVLVTGKRVKRRKEVPCEHCLGAGSEIVKEHVPTEEH